MADSSTLIQTEFLSLLVTVSFDGILGTSIKIKELPTENDPISPPLPAIYVCPYGNYGAKPMGFDGPLDVVHGVEVCLIDSTQGQYSVDQAKRQLWQEQVVQVILRDGVNGFRMLNVANFYDMENVPNEIFDRSKFSTLYSYTSVLFKVHTLG